MMFSIFLNNKYAQQVHFILYLCICVLNFCHDIRVQMCKNKLLLIIMDFRFN